VLFMALVITDNVLPTRKSPSGSITFMGVPRGYRLYRERLSNPWEYIGCIERIMGYSNAYEFRPSGTTGLSSTNLYEIYTMLDQLHNPFGGIS
jgi:hypothetical protein